MKHVAIAAVAVLAVIAGWAAVTMVRAEAPSGAAEPSASPPMPPAPIAIPRTVSPAAAAASSTRTPERVAPTSTGTPVPTRAMGSAAAAPSPSSASATAARVPSGPQAPQTITPPPPLPEVDIPPIPEVGKEPFKPGVPPVRKKPTDVLQEGKRLFDREGRLEVDPLGRSFFVFDSGDKPMQLLENSWREMLETATARGAKYGRWRISGIVTVYEGKNYLLLTRVVRILPEEENL